MMPTILVPLLLCACWACAAGGLATGTGVQGMLEVKLKLDGNQLVGWPDSSAYIHLLGNLGGKPNASLVGSFMGINNAEVPAGLYPIDSEFYVTDASAVFLHPALGMGAEVAASGPHGPSIFSTSALGLRLRVQPGEAHHVDERIGPEKDIPATPQRKREEVLEPIDKFALGFYRYNPKQNDLTDTAPVTGAPLRRTAYGAYALAEHTLYDEADAPTQGLAAFVRYGRTDGNASPLIYSFSAGCIYTRLLPGRDLDVLGLAL